MYNIYIYIYMQKISLIFILEGRLHVSVKTRIALGRRHCIVLNLHTTFVKNALRTLLV